MKRNEEVMFEINRKASELRRKRPELTKEQAITEVVSKEPRLYAEYMAGVDEEARKLQEQKYGEAVSPVRKY